MFSEVHIVFATDGALVVEGTAEALDGNCVGFPVVTRTGALVGQYVMGCAVGGLGASDGWSVDGSRVAAGESVGLLAPHTPFKHVPNGTLLQGEPSSRWVAAEHVCVSGSQLPERWQSLGAAGQSISLQASLSQFLKQHILLGIGSGPLP